MYWLCSYAAQPASENSDQRFMLKELLQPSATSVCKVTSDVLFGARQGNLVDPVVHLTKFFLTQGCSVHRTLNFNKPTTITMLNISHIDHHFRLMHSLALYLPPSFYHSCNPSFFFLFFSFLLTHHLHCPLISLHQVFHL